MIKVEYMVIVNGVVLEKGIDILENNYLDTPEARIRYSLNVEEWFCVMAEDVTTADSVVIHVRPDCGPDFCYSDGRLTDM